MKNLWLMCFASLCLFNLATAQNNPKSPAKSVEATIDGITITMAYHSPTVREREIWGALVPYDKVWRTGANDATTISFSADAKIEGKSIPAGTYSLFTIPNASKWTLILNSEAKQWGSYKYESAKDVLRVEVTPTKSESYAEQMSFNHMDNKIVLTWENLSVPFTISK